MNVSSNAVACVAVRSSTLPVPAVVLPLNVAVATVANFAFVTTLGSIVHVAPDAVTVMSPLSPSVTPPPPAGAAHVPSARRKFVVPPPEAGTTPLSDEVNVSSKAVACVAVKSSTLPVPAVVLPLKVAVATVASFAFVTVLGSIVQTEPEPETVISPLSPSEIPPATPST